MTTACQVYVIVLASKYKTSKHGLKKTVPKPTICCKTNNKITFVFGELDMGQTLQSALYLHLLLLSLQYPPMGQMLLSPLHTLYRWEKWGPEKFSNFLKVTHLIMPLQFSSVAQSCPTLCNPMNHSTPGLPIHHRFLQFTQTHVHWVGDAIQPSHPLLCPSPPALNLSQHQGLFKWVSSSYKVAKVLEFQFQSCH